LGGEVRDRLGDLVESEDIVDLRVEPQVLIPQLQIKLDREKLALRGLTPRAVNHVVETAMNGRVVSRYLEGEASFDIVVRFDEPYRKDMESLKQTAITLPSGGTIPLEDVADILPDRMGPNTIKRENARRRIVVSCNISDRALSEMRDEIRSRLTPLAVELRQLGPGYFIEYGGQFESEEAATRLMGWLSLLSLAGMFLVLYTLFKSVNLVLQVMAVLPMAAIGAVAALLLSGQSLSVPSMVGFVSLAGIASRNGILLITHYLHLVRHEGEAFTQEMVVRAGQERLAPVLMTALTSGIGLVPIVLAGNEPGKEILYPVAIIIVGGLISSTLLEFFVHPALFWTFGRKSAEQLTAETTLDLGDEPA
jgi:Cu/Ag efflux pump CusA